MQNNNFNNQFNPVDAPGVQGYPYGMWTNPLPGRVVLMASQMQMPPQQAVPSMAPIESGTKKRRADEPLNEEDQPPRQLRRRRSALEDLPQNPQRSASASGHSPFPVARLQYSTPSLSQQRWDYQHQHQQHQQRLQVHHSASAVVPYPPSPMPEVAMNLQQRISAYEDARARIASSQRLAQAAQAAGQHRPATTGAHTSAENALPPQPYRKASPLEVLAPQSSFIEFRVNLGGTNFDISTPATEADKCRAKARKEAEKGAQKEAKKKASSQIARTQTGKIRSSPVVAEVAEESQRVVAAVVLERSPSGTDSPTPAEPYRPSEKALGKRKAVDNSPGVDGGECLDGDLPDEAEESTESELVFKADEHSAKETPSSKPYTECNCAGLEHEVSCILDMAFASLPSPPTATSADAVGAGTTAGVADFPALNYLAEGQNEPPHSSARLEEISLQEGEFGFEYWPVSSMF